MLVVNDHIVFTVRKIERYIAVVKEIVGKPLLDHVLTVPRANDEVVKSVIGILLHDMPKDRLSADFDHGLGFKLTFFRNAGPEPAGE